MADSVYSHELSYKGASLTALIHRRRLNAILKVVTRNMIAENGKLADFGCSDGFILSQIQEKVIHTKNWRFFGFEIIRELLKIADKRDLLNTEFKPFNLNQVDEQLGEQFDIVTCFETLEHVGNCKNALINLYNSCKVNGVIIITIPNENHFPGLVKYLGRKILRRNAYTGFFASKSEVNYFVSLLTNKSIQKFRSSYEEHWGCHLGFDRKVFDNQLSRELVELRNCELVLKEFTFSHFGLLYVLKKLRRVKTNETSE